VSYHDPYVPIVRRTRKYDFNFRSQRLTKDFLEGLDAVVITTDHDCVNHHFVVRHAPLVIDTRNATGSMTHERHKVWAA